MQNFKCRAMTRVCSALVILLVLNLVGTVWADKLDDLKQRKAELDQMAANCAVMQEPMKGACLAERQKKVGDYKKDLQSYKADLDKAASKGESQDYESSIVMLDNSIKEFTDYLNSCTDKSERCGTALVQAANLTLRKEEAIFLEAQSKYEKDMQRWEDHDKRGAEPFSPRRNHAVSLGLYQRFLNDYPNNREVPDVLAQAAFIADMQGKDDISFQFLNKLVAGWPNYPQAIKAHLRLGEYWFLKREYAKAIEQLSAVPLDYRGNEAGLALYRRAEAYYSMASFEEAARWFYEYVIRVDAGKIQGGDQREEAMSFMAVAWADMDNGFDAAERFLRSHGNPPWENDVYFLIGVKNKSHDRLDESVKAFRFLLAKAPTYVKAPAADMAIVEILMLQKKPDEAQKARLELANRYAEGSEWFRKNASNKTAVEEASKAVHLALYQIPVYFHVKNEAGDSDATLLTKAEEGYRTYLNRFPNEVSWDVFQVHQHLAVLYGKQKAYGKAAIHWRWCATADTSKMGALPKDKKNLVNRQDAGYNAVFMMDENRKVALKDVYHNDTAATFKGPETKAFLEYVEWYSDLFGNSPSVADIAYNAAILHYEAKQYEDAIKPLSELIAKFPSHPRAILIRRALAQCLLEGGKYDEAGKQFTILQAKLCPLDSQCAEIKKAMASTLFKQAESQKRKGDFIGASQQYAKLVSTYRDVEFADKALFEAGVSADSAGNHDEGARILLRISQDYPKSNLRIKSMLKAASIFMNGKKYRDGADVFLRLQRDFPLDSLGGIQALGWAADAFQKSQNSRQAGQTYESAFRLYPKNDKTAGYLYNAGQLYENSKWYSDAIEDYKLVYENYPSSQYAPEAMFSVPLLMEKMGDTAGAVLAYQNFVAKYPDEKTKVIQARVSILQSRLYSGKRFEMQGDEKQALALYEQCILAQRGSELPPAIASEAAYRSGELFYRKVASVRLDGTKAQNAGRTKTMQENLVTAIQYYAKAVEFTEEEWALRATLRMGDLFSTMALIYDNQRVAGLSGDDRFQVAIQNKVVVPSFLDKGKEIYKKNLDVGLKQGISSQWIDTTGNRLMETYAFKGRVLEDLGQLFLQVPLPEDAPAEDLAQARQQLKEASDQQKSKAVENYRNALDTAQIYFLNNPVRNRIKDRLRELDPAASQLQLEVPVKPKTTPSSETKTPLGGE